ncbi:MAG: c-type cytochrome [Bacteroidetes bacterium]|nr:c-type cytochrome [Bacteroidota bacterium]
MAPDIEEVNDKQILYGRDLVMHTSLFYGPNGKLAKLTNGMNCQNCHLEAGTKVYGNNYSLVASTYPKFRARSGSIESVEKRVRDCFERSLNGKAPADSSKEMQAMVAYIKWVGSEVTEENKPEGTGIYDLPVLKREADPEKGKIVFSTKCVSCHGANGEGVPNSDFTEYTYPPLFGKHSYNNGAGLFRLSRLAGYVKMNMPQGVSYLSPQLTDEEAWDVAAFINTQSRPSLNIQKDWPDISKKPFDHPFGPYADAFSEHQHKLGPFGPIKKAVKR